MVRRTFTDGTSWANSVLGMSNVADRRLPGRLTPVKCLYMLREPDIVNSVINLFQAEPLLDQFE